MARFQALTNAVLDTEFDLLRERFGLEPNQKADLLREMALIAGWVARQSSKRAEARWSRDSCTRRWSGCKARWGNSLPSN
jgi:hypothetical protein